MATLLASFAYLLVRPCRMCSVSLTFASLVGRTWSALGGACRDSYTHKLWGLAVAEREKQETGDSNLEKAPFMSGAGVRWAGGGKIPAG